MIAAFVAGTGGGMAALGKLAWNGGITFVLALLVGTGVAYGVGRLIGFLVQFVGSGSFADWHATVAARWNARMHDHRLAMVGAGVATLLLSIILFSLCSVSFFPPQNSDYSRVNVTMPPGSTLKDTEAVVDRAAAIIAKDPSVDRVFERINVGQGHVNIVLKKNRKVKSTEFERNLSPTLAAMPDARVSFQSQQGGGPDGDSRDIMLYLGGEDPAQLTAVAQPDRQGDGDRSGLAAPRVGSNLAQPEITIKPRFDLAADLGVTTAALSQTIRIATLGEIEQNSAKFSLERPAGADQGLAVGKCSARHHDARESAGADLERRFGSAEGRRRHRLRLRPDDHPAVQPAPPAGDRRRSRAGRRPGRRLGQGQRRCRRSRTCRRASRR